MVSARFANASGSLSSASRKFKPGERPRGTKAAVRDLFAQALTEAQEHEDAEASLFAIVATPGNAKTHHHSANLDPSRRVRATDRFGSGRGLADAGEKIEWAAQDARLGAHAQSVRLNPRGCAASAPRRRRIRSPRASPIAPRHVCDTASPLSDRNGGCRSAH